MVGRQTRAQSRLDRHGRIIIPADLRKELGFSPGQMLSLEAVDGELRVVSLDEAVKRLQEYVLSLTGGKPGVLDEFLADRRREAEGE